MEKKTTQPDSMGKSFPYKSNNQTRKVPSQSSLATKAKNQVKNHTQKHKHTKKKRKENKIKDSNFPTKIGIPPNKC